MKRNTMIGIVIILVLLIAIFLLSPFSPLNKVSVGGEGIDIPDGYKISNSSKTGVTLSNNTTDLSLYQINSSSDLNKTTQEYKEKYSEDFNVSVKKLKTNNTDVYRTIAKPKGKKVVLYWFNIKNKTYQIRSENALNDTDDVALKIISSMG